MGDQKFKPSYSFFGNDLQVKVVDFSEGILSCSVKGKSYTGYAIAYYLKSDLYLAKKYSGSNKTSALYRLKKKVVAEEQRLKDVELAKIENKKKNARIEAKKEESKKQVDFCWNFGKKYSKILSDQGMNIDKVQVYNHWENHDYYYCVNNYYTFWKDSIGNKRTKRLREQHNISKKTGKFETVPRSGGFSL